MEEAEDLTASGNNVSHAYPAAGVYTVALTVTDNRGATNTVTHAVAANPPTKPIVASDTFARTVSNGWGIADVGGAWTTSGTASAYNVGSNTGTMLVATAGGQTSAWLGATSASTDSDVRVRFTINKASTGSGEWIAIVGRRVGGGIEYRGRVRVASNKAVYAIITYKTTASGSEQLIGTETLVSGLTFNPGMILDARLQVVGTNPTTLRLKAWADTANEPGAWNVVKTDSQAQLQAPGAVGVSAFLGASATTAPVTFTFLGYNVVSSNNSPVAAFTSSCTARTCATDATSSNDAEGPISSYTWSGGDGTITTGPTSSHTYATAGTYTVTLTVTDAGSLQTATSSQVTTT